MTQKQRNEQREEALARLRTILKPGDTVYTILKHVSASGMTRSIDVYTIVDNEPRWLAHSVAALGIGSFDERLRAVKIGGCGMDMGFKIVYDLGSSLWPDGTPEPHGTRNGEPDTCGGYALNHRWM